MRRFVAGMALVALLSACSSGGNTGTIAQTTEPTTGTLVSTTEPAASTTTAISSLSQAPVTIAQGANAAPVPRNTYVGIYDASETARQAFEQWWRYEIQTRAGEARGVEAAYTDGVTSVCTLRSRLDGDQLTARLKTNQGYEGSDAAAVVAAAQRALCPKAADSNITATSLTGYLTAFDKGVASAYYRVTTDPQLAKVKRSGEPTLYQVGWFTKFVCGYLAENTDGTNLHAHLVAYKDHTYGSSYLASYDLRTVEILVVTTMNAGCPGLWQKLNEGWYS